MSCVHTPLSSCRLCRTMDGVSDQTRTAGVKEPMPISNATLRVLQDMDARSRDELKETIEKLLKFQAENMKLREANDQLKDELRSLKRKRGKK